jgi:hypothetical protein
MRHGIAVAILFLTPCLLRADSVNQVAAELDAATVLPFAPGVDTRLAVNLLKAQSLASYASALSLDLSIQSVLKAVSLYVWPGGPTVVTKDENTFLLVWAQSRIAINPDLTVGLSTDHLDFGEQPVSTPENSSLLYLIGTLGLGLIVSSPKWSVKNRMKDPE